MVELCRACAINIVLINGAEVVYVAYFLLFFLVLVLFSAFVAEAVAVVAVPFSIAFYYAKKPPLDELQAFDIVVVDPDAVGIRPEKNKSDMAISRT